MYNNLKTYKDKIYSGMKIGGSHLWNYTDGKWYETKIAPDEWLIKFNSIKTRYQAAPPNSGAKIGTKYHWYIIADQIATKLDSDTYMTKLSGYKFKIGHKRPNWKSFSYKYPEQPSYREKVIEVLEKVIERLKREENTDLSKFF